MRSLNILRAKVIVSADGGADTVQLELAAPNPLPYAVDCSTNLKVEFLTPRGTGADYVTTVFGITPEVFLPQPAFGLALSQWKGR